MVATVCHLHHVETPRWGVSTAHCGKIGQRENRFFFKLLRIPLLRNWMNDPFEKQIQGASSVFLCRKRYIDATITATVKNGSVTAVVNLGAAFDTRIYRPPAWKVDQPVNI